MKTDINGCSTCAIGTEKYETYKSFNGKKLVQYEYRHTDGELFSCVSKKLETCRYNKKIWLQQKNK